MNQLNQNLKPFKTVEEAREKGRLGGLSRSPEKSFGAKLRHMKKQGATKENLEKIYNMMMDANYSAGEILLLLESWREKVNPNQIDKLVKCYIEWHRIRHGSKDKQDTNVNVNMRSYRFIVEEAKDGAGNSVDANKEAEVSLRLPPRQNND